MKVLVTGANGFLAANVVRELILRGFEVRGMVRINSDLRAILGLKIEFFYGNITQLNDVYEAVKGCDCIIHIAANTSQRYSKIGPLYEVNVEATYNLVSAAKVNNVSRFIFISTGNTIGFGSKKNPGYETKPIDGFFKKSGYAMSKLEAENIILREVKESHFNGVILNPTFMIGPYDTKPSSGRILKMMYPGRLIFIPKGGKNFVDVRDVAYAICNSIYMGEAGEKYILAGENLTYNEFLTIVKGSKKYYAVLIPNWLIKTLGLAGSILRKLKINSELSFSNAVILTSGDYYSNKKAVRDLKMTQTPISISVRDAIEWFVMDGML